MGLTLEEKKDAAENWRSSPNPADRADGKPPLIGVPLYAEKACMGTEDRIDQFVEHFERQIMLISSITSDPRIVVGASDPVIRVALHKKILYSAILDALAAIRFEGEGLSNTKRLTSMLRLHSGWTACEELSALTRANLV